MSRTARISDCGTYRYELTRSWLSFRPSALFIMLNPSTADAQQDDPTIRRCVGFARGWGYGGLIVCNLFALRATNPKRLRDHADPRGPDNDISILAAAEKAAIIIAAWGTHGSLGGRDNVVRQLLAGAGYTLSHLGLTKDGHPKHPLYLPADAERVVWGTKA